jgi:hypothetical protein
LGELTEGENEWWRRAWERKDAYVIYRIWGVMRERLWGIPREIPWIERAEARTRRVEAR